MLRTAELQAIDRRRWRSEEVNGSNTDEFGYWDNGSTHKAETCHPVINTARIDR